MYFKLRYMDAQIPGPTSARQRVSGFSPVYRVRQKLDFSVTNAFLRCANPARLQQESDSLTPSGVLSWPQMARHVHPFFYRAGTQRGRLLAPAVFRPSRILRYHHLPPPRGAKPDGRTAAGCQCTIGQLNKITVIFGREITSNIEVNSRPSSKT
jgi:hypothetical protein